MRAEEEVGGGKGGRGGEADKWRVVGEGEGELKGVASKGMGADRR